MGSAPVTLAADLRRSLHLERAVETGTYLGGGTRRLADIFPKVVTIELSDELYSQAKSTLADDPRIEPLHGDSRQLLPALVDPDIPTLFFLDGHWSGGPTAGESAECPVLEELAAIRGGSANDCVVIDDARLFTAAPPPPHDATHWPTIMEVFDALRNGWPQHHVTLLDDQVIAVPQKARSTVDRYGQAVGEADERLRTPRRGAIGRLVDRLR